ncbi:MAG: DUF2461 domain-containing protein [Bacteroidales bacterium]|nr:DUF2461 domain-containing protein [Bacteroidales bacterium]
MKQISAFLRRLDANNNREWFQAHKDEFREHQQRFFGFALELVGRIREFDPSIGDLDIKQCTYRIYRDTRFSQDKTPYKIQMGVFVAPMGKKSGYSGYYLQVGAYDKGYPGGCMLAVGDYQCEPAVLKILREDIDLDEGKEFGETLRQAEGFTLDYDQALKRVPRGFDPQAPWADYLRLKNFCLTKEPGLEYMHAPALLDRAVADFKRCKPFLDYINRAIAYSRHQ